MGIEGAEFQTLKHNQSLVDTNFCAVQKFEITVYRYYLEQMPIAQVLWG